MDSNTTTKNICLKHATQYFMPTQHRDHTRNYRVTYGLQNPHLFIHNSTPGNRPRLSDMANERYAPNTAVTCFTCGWDCHTQRNCPLAQCQKCRHYGHHQSICPRNPLSNYTRPSPMKWRQQSNYYKKRSYRDVVNASSKIPPNQAIGGSRAHGLLFAS